jgi:hypothetical protein
MLLTADTATDSPERSKAARRGGAKRLAGELLVRTGELLVEGD